MLVLDRKSGQSVIVNGPAKIVVIRTSSGRIKLGIEADKSVKILRSELLEVENDRDKNAAA